MYENLRKPLDPEQVKGYLARIKMDKEPDLTPNLELLDKLIEAQLYNIPFDDADVWAYGVCPSLATDDLYDKIVTRKRGGYCFELNSLFWRFLQGMGYDARIVLIHLGRADLNFEITPPSHCAVIVKLDGVDRFCDVGLGGVLPKGSVPLTGEVTWGYKSYENGIYTCVGVVGDDGSVTPTFTFKNIVYDPVELVPCNFLVSQKPGSGFAASLKLNLRAADGFAEVSGRKFKYRNGTETIEREMASTDEAKEVALKYFGIPDLPTRDFE